MYATEGGSNILQHHNMNVIQEEFDLLKQAMVQAKG